MPTDSEADDPGSPNEYARAQAAADRARAMLSALPNVVSIGVGTKRMAGVATDTWCISISVRAKLPPDQLPANAIIPPEIDGVPTDVTETGDFGVSMIDPKDKLDCYELNTYRPLRGGIKLGKAWASTHGIEPDLSGWGTMGYIVLTQEATPRHVALTNWHVVAEVLPHGPVGQPHADPGSTCCGSSEMIGNVYDIAHDTFTPPSAMVFPVDAAICSLTDGMTWVAGVGTSGRGTSSPPDPITGTRDLKIEAPPPQRLSVKKRGARTGETTGTVFSFDEGKTITIGARTFKGVDMTSAPHPYYLSLPVLLVEADRSPSFAITGATNVSPCLITAPGHSFTNDQIVYINGIQGMGADINDRVFKVGTVNSPPGTLTLLNLDKTPYNATALSAYTGGGKVEQFEPFSLPGDSGSVVRDSSNKIVGLLFANNFGSPRKPEGFYAYVCHIADVMAAMKITVPVTSTMPGVQTAPANNNPYKHITRASATNAMAKLQNDLLDTEHGVVIARAMLAHEREVRALIRSNRRVAARWRHVSDPRLVDELIGSLFELDRPIVGAAPHDARRALNRFADQLARYGSKSLREDLAQLRDPLIQMVDLTYREILAMLNMRTDVIPPELVDSQAPNEYAIDSAMKIESLSAAIAAFANSQHEVNALIYARNSGPDHTNSEAHR